MKKSIKIDENLSIVSTKPKRSDLAYFNGKKWEYKGKEYDYFEDIPLKKEIVGAYDFIVDLHSRGGVVVNQYVCTGGTHIEYKESGSEELKEIFLNKA